MFHIKPERGFTLIEILVTVFILGVMVALFTAALEVASATRVARHEDLALKIANLEMETLRGLGYDALPASGAFSDSLLSALPSSSASTSITDFNAKTKKVIVGVGWREESGNRVISLTTLVTQIGGLP